MFHECVAARGNPPAGSMSSAANAESHADRAADYHSRPSSSDGASQFSLLHRQLATLVTQQRPLFLAGHSLGGAMASVFAMGLHAR